MRNLDGKFIYVNEAYARMHGYTVKEMLGKGLSFVHGAEQINRVRELREQYEGNYIAEITHKRQDGSSFPALVNGSTIKDEDGMHRCTIPLPLLTSRSLSRRRTTSEDRNTASK